MGEQRNVSRAQWLRRLALRRQHKTAFVLSGGGPYGALQVGMLKALLERDIRPDLMVGTSVGAINATFLAFDPTMSGIDRLSRVWHSLGDEDLFPGSRFKTSWARMMMRGNRIFDNAGIKRLMETRLGRARFEDAQIPLAVLATDMETGHETVFRSGDLLEPILASTAMPGIFPPVEIAGRRFIDGGVSDGVPITPAIEMGAKRIFVLNCTANTQSPRPLVRPMDHLLHAFSLSRAKRFELERRTYEGKVDLIVAEAPDLGFSVPFTSLRHTPLLEQTGYDHMVHLLNSHPGLVRGEIAQETVSEHDRPVGVVPPAESSS